MNVAKCLKNVKELVLKNTPQILTVVAITGVCSTIISSIQSTVKAVEKLKNEEVEEPKEIIKLVWKDYIPPLTIGGLTIGSILMLQNVQDSRQAAMAALLTLSEKSFETYKESVIDILGEKKEEKIHIDASKKLLAKNPSEKIDENKIPKSGKGDTWCFDHFSGRYFKCDIETLKHIQNNLNQKRLDHGWIPLNDLYFELNMPLVKLGELMGWTDENKLDFIFDTMLSDFGEPCIVLDYKIYLAPWASREKLSF